MMTFVESLVKMALAGHNGHHAMAQRAGRSRGVVIDPDLPLLHAKGGHPVDPELSGYERLLRDIAEDEQDG